MTTYNTGNKVGSAAVKDLFDNSENLDKAVNDRENETWFDRLGAERVSLFGAEKKNERLVEKFKNDALNAILAAGYAPVGTFQDGAEVKNFNETVLWKIPDGDGEYYRWDGDLPKLVPENSNPELTGGIKSKDNPNGLWVSVGDASLRTELKSNSGASIVSTENGESVQDNLNVLSKKLGEVSSNSKLGSLANVRIIKELPTRPEKEYKQLLQLYSYRDVYPQGMYMYEDEIFINNTSYGPDAKNRWDWIYVYDRHTYQLKSVFSVGNQNAEGLVIYRHNGIRYLFILEQYSLKGQGKTGVYQLPDDLSSVNMQRLTPIKVHDTYQFYQIGGYKNKLVIEVNYGSAGDFATQRRSKFVYYDAIDLITIDNPKPIGAFSLEPNLVMVGNPQGVCLTETNLLAQHGGYYYLPDYPLNQNTIYAVHRLTQAGSVIDSFSCRADEVINLLRPHLKVNPTRLEGQGVIYFNEKIYSINVLGDPSSVNEFKGGLVILEHNLSENEEGVIKLSDASYPLGALDYGDDKNIQIQTIATDRSQNKIIYTLKEILDMMRRDRINIYGFYNTGLPLVTDINGNEFPWGVLVSIHNLDSNTFIIKVSGERKGYSLNVSMSNEGVYTQVCSTVVEMSDTTLRPEFFNAPRKVQGVDGTVREDVYTNSNGRVQAFTFRSGATGNNSPAVGTIMVDGAAKKTEYLTTSDEEWKIKHGIDKYLPDLISEAVASGAAQNAAFKTSPEVIYPMCMAQKLNKYFPEAVHVGDSSPENPWMVDASKLVPALMIAVAQLNEKLNKSYDKDI
ncbi:hypothetical protein [Providencia rettgeri]|uniref:tail fiber/spike domain-containing protein n=1 Tax=Providencia rettgeri TaxID=587 RepID=UPI00235F81CB|nr:hypothetical protein [Providencia rettgeri]